MTSNTWSRPSDVSMMPSRSTSGSTARTAKRTATATMRSVESFKRRRRVRTAAFATICVMAATIAVAMIVLGAIASNPEPVHAYTFEPVTLTATASRP